MLNKYFVNQGLKEVQIEEFIRQKFPEGDYSRMELQRTPLGIKVVIYSSNPGRIIGRGGRTINEMTEALKVRFNLENPQLDVKPVKNPLLDAHIVAKEIVMALERGLNYKRVANGMIKRVMDAGAIGVQIIIAGRMAGSKASSIKLIDGYIKHSGETSKTLVDRGFEETYRIGKSEPGKVGVKVRIMHHFQSITGELSDDVNALPGRKDQREELMRAQLQKEEAAKEAAAQQPQVEVTEAVAETAQVPATPATDKPAKKPRAKKAKPAQEAKEKE